MKKIPIHGDMNDEDIVKGLSSLKICFILLEDFY